MTQENKSEQQKEERKPRPVSKIQWAVFAPDGNIQFRTISYTRREATELAPKDWGNATWEDYEKQGFWVQRVDVKIKPITK